MATILSSNIVNYVVWRYLQEAGFGNAALQLSRCWNRDPDTLPFARNVEPHTLVRLLQDGMSFDQLQAEACNTEPRYIFGNDHGNAYSVRNGALLTLDQGIPAHQLAAEANGAVQEPPPKKGVKRKKAKPTNGVEPRQEPDVNGDAMDIEQNGATHVTNSVRAESDAIASDAESPTVGEIPLSTLSIGQDAEIQTEVVADLSPNTVFIPHHSESDRLVQHTLWHPSGESILLAAGRSVLQVHLTDEHAMDTSMFLKTADVPLPVNNFAITALCWQEYDEMAVSAREECFNEVGEKITKDKLIAINGGLPPRVISSQAGLVNTLRWNEASELLLSISTDSTKGSIKIWKKDNDSIPAWAEFIDTTIFDALWISETAFVVCGIELLKIYSIGQDGEPLITQRTLDTKVTWEALKYHSESCILAAIGVDGQESYLGILHLNDSSDLRIHTYPDEFVTDLDFRVYPKGSTPSSSSLPSVLLAISFMSGAIRLWDANEPPKCIKRLSTIGNTQALKIAFSPDNTFLAAAGPDTVTIWDLEKREVPVAVWRAQHWPSDKWDPTIDGEFSLGWHPDARYRLSIALGNQIAMIPVPR